MEIRNNNTSGKTQYQVSVLSGIEPGGLSDGREYFITDSLEEAEAVYNSEVSYMDEHRISEDNLGYEPTDEEYDRGLYVSLISFTEDEDPVTLKDSERYFEK